MADRLDKAIDNTRKGLGIDFKVGFTGNGTGNGDPRVRDNSGRMWARFQEAGGFSQPKPYPVKPNANIPIADNIPVKISWEDNEERITEVYRPGLVAAGMNPGITNPSDSQMQASKPNYDIKRLLCKRSADSSKPWAVVVRGSYVEVGGVSRIYPDTEIDFDTEGLVPAAGTRCIACVFLNTDLTLSAYASTPALSIDPILESHIDECRQQAASTSMSIWGWILEGDASGLTEAPEKNIDMRPTFEFPSSGGGSDDTAVYIASWW